MLLFIIILILIITIKANFHNKNEANQETLSTSYAENDEILVGLNEIEEKEKDKNKEKLEEWNLILVNKENLVPDNYQIELQNIDSKNKVDIRIVDSLNNMLADAKKEGLKPIICSSYRENSKQVKLYTQKVNQYKNNGYTDEQAKEVASYWVAPPKTSEHEIGLAVDIVSSNYQILDEKQEDTLLQKWLIKNSWKYGFILRYPTDKKDITQINYEPWHYRYVGVEHAKFITENGYCLEEYINYLQSLS